MKHALGRALLLLLASAGGADAAGRCGDHPWCDTSLPADTRAGLLLEQLTPDERISLLAGDDLFAPTVNIMRTPLGGRTFEGYGEDPWLVGRMAVGWIAGAQSEGVIANVKHFAANNQEGVGPGLQGTPLGVGVVGDRFTVNAVVDERTLREIYLPAFETAVNDANVGSIMCSYNRLNGQYACENEHLLETILRQDWRFEGYVLSDYGAAHANGTAASLNDGLDFEPWPGMCYSPL